MRALRRILHGGIVPVVRTSSGVAALRATAALLSGGLDVVEITLTIPGALGVIETLRAQHGAALLVGAGSVRDAADARAALSAGAEFVVSPGLDRDVVALCRAQQVLAVPGVSTPTEVLAARAAGAELFKLFPCAQLGGPRYLKALRGPLPELAFMPTGGVGIQTVSDYVRAGAAALGVGGELVDPALLERGDEHTISERAREFLRAFAQARAARSVLEPTRSESHA